MGSRTTQHISRLLVTLFICSFVTANVGLSSPGPAIALGWERNFQAQGAGAGQEAVFTLGASRLDVGAGDEVEVWVNLSGSPDVFAYQVAVEYPAIILEVVDIEGNRFAGAISGAEIIFAGRDWATVADDERTANEKSYLIYAATLLGNREEIVAGHPVQVARWRLRLRGGVTAQAAVFRLDEAGSKIARYPAGDEWREDVALAGPVELYLAGDDSSEETGTGPGHLPASVGKASIPVLPANIFADIEGHWARPYIEALARSGLFPWVSADRYEPDRPLARAEFAVMLVKLLNLQPGPPDRSFRDVPPEMPYAGAITAGRRDGLFRGYEDGTFRPGREITREEMAAITARALTLLDRVPGVSPWEISSIVSGFSDGNQVSAWARQAVTEVVAAGLMQGTGPGTFNPRGHATRAQGATLLHRLQERLAGTP
ncbi:MAG: hypothetical protein D9V47_08835 [Clostridia bacterium]|nr:MAG: hypothetical protein D9V47_08835 [Clostridia bacterium]